MHVALHERKGTGMFKLCMEHSHNNVDQTDNPLDYVHPAIQATDKHMYTLSCVYPYSNVEVA